MDSENGFLPEEARAVEGEHSDDVVYLFRGVPAERSRDRLGAWWSEDPYLAIGYPENEEGEMFVATVPAADMPQFESAEARQRWANSKARVLDLGDPPNARKVEPSEIQQLLSRVEAVEDGLPMSWGNVDIRQACQEIFGGHSS